MNYQSDSAVIITDLYWRRRFNADTNILGRPLRVDGVQKMVVGVLPPGFRFLFSKAQLYLPRSSNPGDREITRRHANQDYAMIGRLRSGFTVEVAQSQIDANNAAHAKEYPDAKIIAEAGFRTIVTPLHADHIKAVRPTLVLVQAGVFCLLLIGGVNLVNLLLIRASSRTRELAIRQSLGASRWHLVRQVLTEITLLTFIGGLFGVGVGVGGIRFLSILGVQQLPLGANIGFNGRLALVAILAAIAIGIVIAVPLAWFTLYGHSARTLRSEVRSGTTSRAAQRLRLGFIVAQIALAFVLLAAAGQLVLSLQRAMAVSPGFRSEHILTGRISLPSKNYPDLPSNQAFIERLLAEIRRQPDVSGVGVVNNVPFSGSSGKDACVVKGHVRQPGEAVHGYYLYGVSGDFFSAIGIPLREGRFLVGSDADNRVCAVDENFARRHWPNGGAIGQLLFIGGVERANVEGFTIVGVVGAIKQEELTEGPGAGAVYFPYKFLSASSIFAVVRTSQQPESLALGLQKIVRAIDPELPVNDIRSMEERIAETLVVRRSPTLLTGLFAAVALLLAAIGTYGVLAFAVSERHHEIGVRMALGALPKQIGNQFLSLGLRLLASGIILGAIGSWVAGRAIQSILFSVPPLPVTTFAAATVIMIVVSLLASWLPARRATKVDPMVALRHE
jgi:predicted permease